MVASINLVNSKGEGIESFVYEGALWSSSPPGRTDRIQRTPRRSKTSGQHKFAMVYAFCKNHPRGNKCKTSTKDVISYFWRIWMLTKVYDIFTLQNRISESKFMFEQFSSTSSVWRLQPQHQPQKINTKAACQHCPKRDRCPEPAPDSECSEPGWTDDLR